jgi:crotonobetainyl-CoA:carnitine CoA-transferase CaiB-like acyl-CoA transferase
MSDNLFPFMYWAIGNGLGAGQWPGNGTDLVTGGTPRYRLYPTQDGGMVAAAPIEQKFWETFCTLIDLDASLRDDARDPAATTARVAEIIAGRTAAAWRELFAGQDCCCSVVADVRTALDDPHFKARGLFGHVLVNEEGRSLPALPVPIDPGFRAAPDARLEAPLLGAHNEELLS